ncbi:hypothetical protein [Flavobacterium johnsoniae]|uniref:hypothetical protein n=1 Tax=Flavobacterium johnsoniae TaxID=986 RepID=UPI001CA8D315|nr:hypothetical protein [Flavobacterium johnsoniae]
MKLNISLYSLDNLKTSFLNHIYLIMKNISQIELPKYNTPNYELIENGIYFDKQDGDLYVFAVTYELEENEDSQYPLEDILDEFYLHVSDFVDEDAFNTSKIVTLELGGDLEDAQKAVQNLIGKRAYNAEDIDEDGNKYIKLVIE